MLDVGNQMLKSFLTFFLLYLALRSLQCAKNGTRQSLSHLSKKYLGENVSSWTTNTSEIFDPKSILRSIFLMSVELIFYKAVKRCLNLTFNVNSSDFCTTLFSKNGTKFCRFSCVICVAWNSFPIDWVKFRLSTTLWYKYFDTNAL